MARLVYFKEVKVTDTFSKFYLVDKFGKNIVHDYWTDTEGPRQAAKDRRYDFRGRLS